MLSLKNVTAGYKKREEIIKNISITFEKGTITSVIGKNGCGKTTLLKASSSLLKPIAGEIMLNDMDGWSSLYTMKSSQVAKKISFLPQNKDIPNISVYNLVMHGRFPYLNFARIPRQEDKIAVQNAMELVNVRNLSCKNVQELSGGQRQKVYIAMILAQDTNILFLDEPTTYLDINHQLEILKLISELKNMGKTVIMAIHDLSNALAYSDKICLMDRGGILIYDTPKTVIESKLINRTFNIDSEELHLKGGNSRQYIFTLPQD